MISLRRRGRFYAIVAVVMVFLVYRFTQDSWTRSPHFETVKQPNQPASEPVQGSKEAFEPPVVPPPVQLPDSEKDADSANQPKPVAPHDDSESPEKVDTPETDKSAVEKPVQAGDDTKEVAGEKTEGKTEDTKQPAEQGPPQIPPIQFKDPPKQADNPDVPLVNVDGSKIHWTKPKEHFPIPPESIRPIPTGTAPNVYRIQFDFQGEDVQTSTTRLDRLGRVKSEIARAWSGYRKSAFMHDELSPASMKYRDTFCGWGATLVDSLDTLWIAGMRDEFDEAAKAVAKIDFTYTDRNDIPVFETTIRYLGGLIGAYDVSGGSNGQYKILLDKAVELAEILMGVFDTPNRMPLLYYRWREPYASQPHRAGTVGIAELGTLSLEFTRLAQLTGTAKYYDAIDRITDALIDMQAAGTDIPGLFPQRINASGCNRTADTQTGSLSQEAREQVNTADLTKEPQGFDPTKQGETAASPPQLKDDGRWHDKLRRRDTPSTDQSPPQSQQVPPLAADGSTADWDCKPQGLVSGSPNVGQYHMGGAQDSAYEYFPKQYLLLNGLEPKYRALYENTIDAINEWLLYRPMIKDEGWDVFFTGKLTTSSRGDSEWTRSYELAHLTCFIGGMYGLGGKIFGRDGDIDKAKKLTDGCVWAYQSTATGLMPEFAHLVACPALEKCPFSEESWYEDLDPNSEWRDNEFRKWSEGEALKKVAESGAGNNPPAQADKPVDSNSGSKPASEPAEGLAASEKAPKVVKRDGMEMPKLDKSMEEDHSEFGSTLPDSLKQKIGLNKPAAEKADISKTDADQPNPAQAESENQPAAVQDTAKKASETKPAIPDSFDARKHGAQVIAPPDDVPLERPQTHEEYVKSRIEKERLPPGYTDIQNRNYMLRPEAVESVWYMYRITGDTTWMDKGWKMFQATIAATRTEFANSAIEDVTDKTQNGLKDEMESFWISETLKYYYLLFSEPNVISLDEWVLNTEAHPFKRSI
ncbi:glycosyl hydrolase family 47-domain-containing protein [Fusarium flagelliforme]|uniref:alpha-1,2-Mannosidase n=1 Tax=Fusarium flagelliforme TaxID=2675880 RepID=A0A395MW22_9HYPO|nr:glycosyl hydrolase family 47-domain-containing protein [Fusarium flagelliforme]KAH7192385.1 glycosyl hydrolase family 47-domain-containing protein [Fusarium flagelliforme]RFN51419.1 mannosyl-oligosaccharide alpha-1,2-mannosidase [Fusarium flagelliforme]